MKNILLSLVLLTVLGLRAQETGLPEIIPPSPTVANLMAFEEVPVDTYTGQPNIAIPLYSKSIGANMTIGAALRYHTSGVQIDNISGWTGTGWSLDIGGTISRTVRGTPDEEDSSGPRLGVLHNDGFWNHDPGDGEFNFNTVRGNGSRYDTQLDLYQFSLFGASGRFVIVRNESGGIEPKLLSRDQRVKIELTSLNNDLSVNSFTIIDTYGYRYFFDVKESSISRPFSGSEQQGFQGDGRNISANGGAGEINSVSAWHLSKVTTSNGLELASIIYQQRSHTYTTAVTRTWNEINPRPANINTLLSNPYNLGVMKPKLSITYHETQMFSQKPSVINFKDGSSMEFIVNGSHPENNGEVLREIIIKNADGSPNKTFMLDYETTPGNNRLWLMGVNEVGIGDVPVLRTLLRYNDKHLLPGFDSDSDIWGYNRSTSPGNTFDCGQQLDFKAENITIGLLSALEYPTGGSKDFIFEHNTYSYVGDQPITTEDYTADLGNRTFDPNGGTDFDIVNSGGAGMVDPVSFVIDVEQQVFVRSSLNPGSQSDDNIFRMVIQNLGGQEFSNDPIGDRNCLSYTLPPGNYLFGVKYFPLNADQNTVRIQGRVDLFYTRPQLQMNEFVHGGGVRIKEVLFKDPELDSQAPQRRFLYDYSDPQDPLRSTGVVDSKLGNLAKNYRVQTNDYLFPSTDNFDLDTFTLSYLVRTQGVNAQMTKGGYVGYRSVKVSQEGNGHTLFNYTSPFDHPSPVSNFEYPFAPTSNIEFKRGLMTSQQVYRQDGKILTETINDPYDFREAVIAPSFNIYEDETRSEGIEFFDSYSQYESGTPNPDKVPRCGGFAGQGFPCINSFGNNPGVNPFETRSNPLTDGWARLMGSRTKAYFYEGSGPATVVERYQTFEYNEENFRQSVSNTFIVENGETEHYRTETFYPIGSDILSSPYIGTKTENIDPMIALNMVDIPLYTRSLKDNEQLSETHSLYTDSHPDRMDLFQVISKKGEQPLDPRVEYKRYDSYGNPLEVSLSGGPSTTYLWGHEGTYPLAKIDNATYQEVLGTGVNLALLNKVHDDPATKTQDEANKKTELDKVRTGLPKSLVSTFAIDPLVGTTSATDPSGYAMAYEYDGLNRLKRQRDDRDRIEKEYFYHYRKDPVLHSDFSISAITAPERVFTDVAQAYSITASRGSGNFSYSWSFSALSGASVTASGASINLPLNTNFIGEVAISCTVRDLDTGKENTATATVNVYRPLSLGPVSSETTDVQVNAPVDFSVNPQHGSGAYGYTWEFITATNTQPDPPIVGQRVITKVFGQHFSGNVTVRCTVQDLITGEQQVSNSSVNILAPLSLGNIEIDNVHIDAGEHTEFSVVASGGTGNYNYHWVFVAPGATIDLPAAGATVTPPFTPSHYGNVEITVTVTDGPFSETDTRSVTVHAPLVPGTVGLPATIVRGPNGTSIPLDFASDPTGGSGSYGYVWHVQRPDGSVLREISVGEGNTSGIILNIDPDMDGPIRVFCTVTDTLTEISKDSSTAQSTVEQEEGDVFFPPGGGLDPGGTGDTGFQQTQAVTSDGSTALTLQPNLIDATNSTCAWYVDYGNGNGFVETSSDPALTLLLPCGDSAQVKCIVTDTTTGISTQRTETITQTCN